MNMKTYKKVEGYTLKSLHNIDKNVFNSIKDKSEMLDSEVEFLCGLIRDNKPKKIVEVGVSAGGTTAVILHCLSELDYQCEMYSVDLSEKYYRDINKNSGYIAEDYKLATNYKGNHKLLLGKVLPEQLEQIGGDIDFIIIDTVHSLPGEVIDFLAAFPYLSENAVVVLHDTFLHYKCHARSSYATSILYQSVTADKYLNNQSEYPNIAAFTINQDTEKYILDVFNSLIITWSFVIDDDMFIKYRNLYAKYYGAEAVRLFEQAFEAAKKFHSEEKDIRNSNAAEVKKALEYIIDKFKHENILLYGAGEYGKSLLKFMSKFGVKVSGFVVSEGHATNKSYCGLPVYSINELTSEFSDCIIFKAASSNIIDTTLKSLSYKSVVLPNNFLMSINSYIKSIDE